MDRDNLITNMTDQIKEAQMKLGYVRETVRLYYPLSSLYAIMGHDIAGEAGACNEEETGTFLREGRAHFPMAHHAQGQQHHAQGQQQHHAQGQQQHHAQGQQTLYARDQQLLRTLEEAFAQDCVLGRLSFALHGDRVEVSIPPQGVEYVHFHVEEPAFLAALIALFKSNRHCSLGDIRGVFERFSGDYVCEELAEDVAEYMGFDYVLYFKDTSIDAYYYCVKEEMGHTVYHRFTREDYRHLFFSMLNSLQSGTLNTLEK